MQNRSQFYKDAEEFLTILFYSLEKISLNVASFELDHVCYRVDSIQKYDAFKSFLFSLNAELIIESIIGGRLISTFKLEVPIEFNGRKIYYIELPSPKPDSFYADGFEHAEFVLPILMYEFMKLNPNQVFDTKGLEKQHNPEIKIQFNNISVKFHSKSLIDLISIENLK